MGHPGAAFLPHCSRIHPIMAFVSVTPAHKGRTLRLPAVAGLYVSWFWGILALSALHRVVASWPMFVEAVLNVYSPQSWGEAFGFWIRIYGDSSLLGLSQDVVFASLAAAVFVISGRTIRGILLVTLCVFLTANAQHVRYNLTHINLSTAQHGADSTFVLGMLNAGLLHLAALFACTGILVAAIFRWKPLRFVGGILLPLVLGFSLFAAPAPSFVQPGWLQAHPLLGDPVSGRAVVDEADFSPLPFAHRPPPPAIPGGYNLLVLYLEGMSGHSIAAGDMAGLRALSERGISFDRYFGAQLITANGLYTSLTGDLPNFVSGDLRWDGLDPASDIAKTALPNRLREAGYHTAFLQSAPLDYMSKDVAMPRMGFETVLGRPAWSHAFSVDGWGIDDRAMLQHTIDYIDGIAAGQPWFVSVLTTGTHPPYNVPPDFLAETPRSRYVALRYLDQAVTELMTALDERGLLETTVVVITSDESRELVTDGDLRGQVALNWLPMIVIHPSGHAARIDTPIAPQRFGEVVIPLLDKERSAERADPGANGPIVFGNTYAQRLYVFDPADSELLVCATSSFTCAEFAGVSDPVTVGDTEPARIVRRPALEALVRDRESAR